MLCSPTNLFRRNLSAVAVSASLLLSKRLSPSSKQTLLSFPQISPVSLVSPSIETGFSRSFLGSLRFDHIMAGQSSKGSIHDFNVKVGLDIFDFKFMPYG